MMATLSGLDPIAVYLKFRPFAAVVTLLSMAALAQRMTGRSVAGWTALVVFGVGAITNHAGFHSGYFAQLLPVSHPSDVTLGMGLAFGGYFFWASATAEKRFGAAFWCAAAVTTAVLVCHAREGLQLVVLSGVLFGTGLLFRSRNRTLLLHAAALAVLLVVVAKAYQGLQSGRTSHLAEWEDEEKAVARERFDALAGDVREGHPDALFGPRIDRTTSYLYNYDFFFRPVYALALAAAIGAFWSGRALWACFVPLLMGAVMLASRLPSLALPVILASYSQVWYTPARFVLHWEWLILAIGAVWAAERAAAATEGARWPATAAAVAGAAALGCLVLPALGGRLSDFGTRRPDLTVALFAIALQAGALWRLYRWSKATATPEESEPRPVGWRYAALAAALVVPMLCWNSPPTMAEQVESSAARPDGLDVDEWCARTGLLDLPAETMEFVRRELPHGRVLAYDPRYIFNLPAVFDHYVFTFGFYYFWERGFFDRYYEVRDRTPPFDPSIRSMYRFTEVYIRDLMLRFPLYNWRDPIEVTLRDIGENGIDVVIVNPEFDGLWRTYAEYFPDAFPLLHRSGAFAVYGVEREALRRSLEAVRSDPEAWGRRDLENGYVARATAGWPEVRARLPESMQPFVPDAATLERITCFVPAQKHYDVHVDGRAWLTPDGTPASRVRQSGDRVELVMSPAQPEVMIPIFLPKSRPYTVVLVTDGAVRVAENVGQIGNRFWLYGQGFQMLRLKMDGPGEAAVAVRIVEDEAWAAMEVWLPVIDD